MKVLRVRNVNDAWAQGVHLLLGNAVNEESRAGPVLVYPEPVTTVYERPQERVLFCDIRRANPFFHLFESMWMLAGENNARWLDQFVHDFSERFAEEDGTLYGAYGYRWRNHFGGDQLIGVQSVLKRDPGTRQAVLQMWDPDADLGAVVKDKPCNTTVYFRTDRSTNPVTLHMTVLCRSNDIVWGAYGANAVHFSILHEYMAASCGMQMGRMWQVSNNWHGYSDVLLKMLSGRMVHGRNPYALGTVEALPLFSPENVSRLYGDLCNWMKRPAELTGAYHNGSLINGLLVPMYAAHEARAHLNDALRITDEILYPDWRLAAVEWLQRRRSQS